MCWAARDYLQQYCKYPQGAAQASLLDKQVFQFIWASMNVPNDYDSSLMQQVCR
jgi:hypothetical protein